MKITKIDLETFKEVYDKYANIDDVKKELKLLGYEVEEEKTALDKAREYYKSLNSPYGTGWNLQEFYEKAIDDYFFNSFCAKELSKILKK